MQGFYGRLALRIGSNVTVVMRDYKQALKMNNRRQASYDRYDKDMDYAFTLIFHNIKRLQDGHLCNSDPNLTQAERDVKQTTAPKVPVKKRSRSEPFLGFAEGRAVQEKAEASPSLRSDSRSLRGEGSSLQGRRVRFADDCGVREYPKGLHFPSSKSCFKTEDFIQV